MKIDNYSFGNIKIDGSKYTDDILIYGEEIKDSWWREEGHSLSLKDLEWLLDREPDIIIIGRGKNGIMKVPQELRKELSRRGYELKIFKTPRAVNHYNNALKNGINVGAGFHLTC